MRRDRCANNRNQTIDCTYGHRSGSIQERQARSFALAGSVRQSECIEIEVSRSKTGWIAASDAKGRDPLDARVADVAGSGLGEHGGVSYAISQSSGLANLSEDPASGAGFYQLPKQCRTGSLYERRQRPVEYAGERSANGAAIATEAIAYDNDQGHFFWPWPRRVRSKRWRRRPFLRGLL